MRQKVIEILRRNDDELTISRSTDDMFVLICGRLHDCSVGYLHRIVNYYSLTSGPVGESIQIMHSQPIKMFLFFQISTNIAPTAHALNIRVQL